MPERLNKRPNMVRGPFNRPPGFPNGGGRNPQVVGGQSQGTPQPTLPDESGQAPTGQQPPAGGFPTPGQGADMPWLDAWEGPFAAPMSPWENQGLEGLSDFAGNDFGLGEAEDYLSRVFGGDYLSGNEPNFQAIEDSGRVLQEMQDDRALREMQSRAAAGGNALSGALLQSEGDYLRGSNASFNNMMAQLRAANYGRERGFQQDAVRGALGLSDQRLGGFGALMGAGAVPREIADREIAGQYGDFLRQGRDFRDAYRYPDELALATARTGYPGSHPVLFGDSDAEQLSALLAQLFGGGGLAGGIGDFFGGLLGGGEQPAADGVAAYDGEGPSSYKDSDFYNAALSDAQRKQRENPPGKASGAGKAMMIMALLAQVLGIGKQNGPQGGRKGGGGGGNSLGKDLGEAARKGLDSLFNKNPYKNDPKLQAAWAKHFDKSGKPREKAEPMGYENDLSDITKLQESGLEGDSTDWTSHSDYSDDEMIDSQLFGSGGIDEVWNDVFDNSDWDTMGGDHFVPDSSFNPDSGGFDLGPDSFTIDPTGGDNVFNFGESGGGGWDTVDNSGWDDGGIDWSSWGD